MASNFATHEELHLPQTALAKLYAGAFGSDRPEKNLQQITLFLAAVDVLPPDEATPEIDGPISTQLYWNCVARVWVRSRWKLAG